MKQIRNRGVSSPSFHTIVTLKQPQDKLMFQKPLNNALASANNKHCSLHRIYQVDMKDSWLADIEGCLVNVSYPKYCLGKPPKCEGSVVGGFLLAIENWQIGLCGKHPEVFFWGLPASPGKSRIFPGRSGMGANRKERYGVLQGIPPYLEPNVGREQRETLTLNAPQEQGPLFGSLSHTDLKLVQ